MCFLEISTKTVYIYALWEMCCLKLGPYQLSAKTSSKLMTQMSGMLSNPGRWIYRVPAHLYCNGCTEMCYVCRKLLCPHSRLWPEELGSRRQGDSSLLSGLGILLRLLTKKIQSRKSIRGWTFIIRTERLACACRAASDLQGSISLGFWTSRDGWSFSSQHPQQERECDTDGMKTLQ